MLKNTFIGFLLLLGLCVSWVVFHSYSADEQLDEKGLTRDLALIPSSQNALLKYPEFRAVIETFAETNSTTKLIEHVEGKTWDSRLVLQASEIAVKYVPSFSHILEKYEFQMPGPNAIGYISNDYAHLININRLVLINAEKCLKDGKFEDAAFLLSLSLKLSEKVMSERRHLLISYVIGLVMRHDALAVIHRVVNQRLVTGDELENIKALLTHINNFKNDSTFEKVFAGEYGWSKEEFALYAELTFLERLKVYDEIVEERMLSDTEWMARLSATAQVLFPKYYRDDVKSLNQKAISLSHMKNQSSEYCQHLDFDDGFFAHNPFPDIKDFLTPNMYMKKEGLWRYEVYFWRRCMMYFYTDAVKTVISLQQFYEKSGVYPEALQELVPEYLEQMPLDYVNGEPIKYSRKTGWLYSVGGNLSDDGGSTEAVLNARCMYSEACKNNPTVLFKIP